jgi:hypothetical protein
VKVRFAAFQRPRGQPLLVFAMVLGGWLVLRVLLWEAPFAGLAPARAVGANLAPPQTAMRRAPVVHPAAAKPARHGRTDEPPARHFAVARSLAGFADRLSPKSSALLAQNTADCSTCGQDGAERIFQAESTQADQRQSADRFARSSPGIPRWSGDAWLFLRKDSAAPLVAGSEVRPAAFAVTELPPARLPLGFRAELYAQAGYVGGRFATAFADGQVRVDRQVVPIGENAELRVGGAVSGGAQKHAERLDVGPSAAVSFRLGEANSRLALDYRFRVAGDAEPRSGPALTFSAGF